MGEVAIIEPATCQVSRDVVPCSTSLPNISQIVAQMQRWKGEWNQSNWMWLGMAFEVIENAVNRSLTLNYLEIFSWVHVFRFQMFAACGWENLQVRLTSNTQGALRVTHKVSSDSAKEACNILFQVTDHFHFHFVSFSEFSWDFCVFFWSFLSWQPLGMWPSRCWLWWNQSARRREKDIAIIITHHTHLHFRNSKTWPNTQVCRIPCRVKVVIVVG